MKKWNLSFLIISATALTACGGSSNTTSVTAVVANQSTTLSWTAGTNNVADYYIEQSSAGGAFTRVAATIAPTTTAVIGGLVKGTAYTFRVQSHNTAGASAYTNSITVTP